MMHTLQDWQHLLTGASFTVKFDVETARLLETAPTVTKTINKPV
jgi:hypothetical protein